MSFSFFCFLPLPIFDVAEARIIDVCITLFLLQMLMLFAMIMNLLFAVYCGLTDCSGMPLSPPPGRYAFDSAADGFAGLFFARFRFQRLLPLPFIFILPQIFFRFSSSPADEFLFIRSEPGHIMFDACRLPFRFIFAICHFQRAHAPDLFAALLARRDVCCPTHHGAPRYSLPRHFFSMPPPSPYRFLYAVPPSARSRWRAECAAEASTRRASIHPSTRAARIDALLSAFMFEDPDLLAPLILC
jgi:hypothetical protein